MRGRRLYLDHIRKGARSGVQSGSVTLQTTSVELPVSLIFRREVWPRDMNLVVIGRQNI